MFARIIGAVATIYFGVFAIHTWFYIATQTHNWRNYLAASICTILAAMGFWMMILNIEPLDKTNTNEKD